MNHFGLPLAPFFGFSFAGGSMPLSIVSLQGQEREVVAIEHGNDIAEGDLAADAQGVSPVEDHDPALDANPDVAGAAVPGVAMEPYRLLCL